MKIKFQKKYLIGISIAILILIIDFLYFFGKDSIDHGRWFYAILILAITIAWLHFWIDFFREVQRQKQIETKFLEFVRALVGTVKSGIPIPQALIEVSKEDYGALTPYAKKLSNQIEWGIPIHQALITFSEDTNNPVIKRSVSIVIEAEKSGGDIENVLDSVTTSVLNVKKMKEERKSSVYSQIVQGYIVFFIFIAIMLVLQLKLFPQFEQSTIGGALASTGISQGIIGEGEKIELSKVFFGLIIIQGFFAGLMIGKFSEGTIKQGLLHSLILITLATLIITTVKGGI